MRAGYLSVAGASLSLATANLFDWPGRLFAQNILDRARRVARIYLAYAGHAAYLAAYLARVARPAYLAYLAYLADRLRILRPAGGADTCCCCSFMLLVYIPRRSPLVNLLSCATLDSFREVNPLLRA